MESGRAAVRSGVPFKEKAQVALHKLLGGVDNVRRVLVTLLIGVLAIAFLFPVLFTIVNAFMEQEEIVENYGMILEQINPGFTYSYGEDGSARTYGDEANLKLIPDNVTLSQLYTVLMKSPDYLLKFWNSVLIAGLIVLGQVIIGALAAYAFAKVRSKWVDALFYLYIIMMLMPFQVTLVPNYLMADWMGILNSYAAIILPGAFSTFGVFLLRQFMMQVPDAYIEAARLDAAGEVKIFRKIVLPMCKPGLASLCILTFIDMWNMVEQPLILLQDTALYPLSVFLSRVNSGQLGIAFAAATVYMIPVLLVFLYGEKYLVQGILHSGVKS